ncbi:NRDE family protein [Halomonas sp. MCCC 1A17488]|uniref:NRDE family protein n=1 Tax=Billgrantia sulfidoxydans TaxID=2733484 RepID=A0ABX7W8L0_9GAMM|nr:MULTISPECIES: NRDE family protein [Halomonas]MCE8018171.1 NRDE family protein [Halomonas sp. MCCC 1A17488]MCG3241504.1 NRDE family protein [Halomonas sp. MCCC 1A17488]QPP48540.1 NRDE family protein [Halomonas sp. SS10-MC5]QTP55887.1 NRDE family protein [Halomonas sulfidoxydans]
MCLIAFDFRPEAPVPLRLIANRDEFHQRPTAALGAWQDAPDIVGGRDLEAGGSWLAVHRRGRVAAVTNVRDPELRVAANAPSRGRLVREALECADLPGWLARLAEGDGWRYAGFNLLAGDGHRLWHLHRSRERLMLAEVTPGVHGLSNASLDTPWPKLIAARQGLATALRRRWPEDALSALSDSCPADDHHLPDTGVGLELERRLSPAFIVGEQYGTRATTWLEWSDEAGVIVLEEHRYGPAGTPLGVTRERISLQREHLRASACHDSRGPSA